MDSFFAYAQRLELMAFFSGYPLVYTVVLFIAGSRPLKYNFKSRISSLLPFAYALVGSLYLSLQVRNLYPDYSIQHINRAIQQPYLVTWALLSILFWVPAFGKKRVFSLLHSLVFFLLLVKDLCSQLSAPDSNIVRNDMTIYTTSLIINFSSIALLTLVSFLYAHFHKRPLENS
jgi:hypothetical protein